MIGKCHLRDLQNTSKKEKVKNRWDKDEKWKNYLSNITLPDGISQDKEKQILERYKRKFYIENVEKLPEECPFELQVVEPTEKHTASVIFLHGLGVS